MDLELCEEAIKKMKWAYMSDDELEDRFDRNNKAEAKYYLKKHTEENPQFIQDVFAELQKSGTKVSAYTEECAINLVARWSLADYREVVYNTFPDNSDVILAKQHKEAIQTVMHSDGLDLYQLNTCLNVDDLLTREIIEKEPEIREKIEKMFGNPKDFHITEKLFRDGLLNNFYNMEQKFAQTQENLENRPGKEIFATLRTNITDIPEYQRADLLEKVLCDYENQVSFLSCRDRGYTDLYYTKYKGKPTGNHLAIIGKFKNQPEVEKLIEDKVGKLYSYFSYPTLVHESDAKERYYQVENFVCICKAGGNVFADNMKEELVKDAASSESAFYIKHAVDVLAQLECGNRYSSTVTEIIPQIIDKHPDVCETLINGMKRDKKCLYFGPDAIEKVMKEFKNNPESAVSRFYQAHLPDLFTKIGGEYDRTFYSDTIKEVLAENKEKHPEFCRTFVNNMVTMYQDVKDMSIEPLASLAKVYAEFPTEKMKEFLNDCAAKIKVSRSDLVTYAHMKKQTGLELFDKIEDKIIAEAEKSVRLVNLQNGFDYTDLYAKLEKAGVEEIYLNQERNQEYNFDCSQLAKITSLTYIGKTDECRGDMEFKNPESLLQLPNLRTIDFNLSEEQMLKFHEILMQEKPQNLHKVKGELEEEKRDELMNKYHDLIVETRLWDGLLRRNEYIVESLYGKHNLREIASEGCLLEYLSVLPKEKRPDFDELAKVDEYWEKSPLDYLKSPAEKYYEKLYKIADIIGAEDVKGYFKLRALVEEGKLMEFMQNAKPEELPKLESFCVKNSAFGNKSIFDLLDNEEDKFKILKIMNVNEKDAERLSKLDGMSEAVAQWHEQQKIDKADADAQAAFKAWQESKGIKR